MFKYLIYNMLNNKSDVSFGASVFLYFFMGTAAYLIMFRLCCLTSAVDLKPLPKHERTDFKFKGKTAIKRFMRRLWLCDYKNPDKYTILHKKLYFIAYLFNILYLSFFNIYLLIIAAALIFYPLRQLSIYLSYIHVYFFVIPAFALGAIGHFTERHTHRK